MGVVPRINDSEIPNAATVLLHLSAFEAAVFNGKRTKGHKERLGIASRANVAVTQMFASPGGDNSDVDIECISEGKQRVSIGIALGVGAVIDIVIEEVQPSRFGATVSYGKPTDLHEFYVLYNLEV